MGIFKSKTQKEIEQRMLIRRTINSMKKRINDFENSKKIFLEKATLAKSKGLQAQYDIAVSGFNAAVAHQNRINEMLLNIEITAQMKDMSAMTKDFLSGLSSLSKEMVKLTKEKEFMKVQMEFEKAMQSVEAQTERIDAFMDASRDGFANSVVASDEDASAQMEEMLANQETEQGANGVNEDIAELRKKINQTNKVD